MTSSTTETGHGAAPYQPASHESRARRLIRFVGSELRDYPATAVFSLSWIVVFLAMVRLQLQHDHATSWWRLLVLGIGDGHRFGDLTLDELFRGQVWRLVTCNFVHYSVIHIALNLLAFYLLGTLLESWYGSGQLVLIYGLTGAGGNLLSALARRTLGWSPMMHAGGGSVVVMGLVGLCAVVGWRSRTERGSDLGWQMSKALGMTCLLGVAFPRYIDNMGHAGGAIVGFVLGLFHRWFLKRYGRPGAWGAGAITGIAIALCGLIQLRYDRAEGPLRREFAGWGALIATQQNLEARVAAYRAVRDSIAVLRLPNYGLLLAPLVDRVGPVLDAGPTQPDYRRLRELAQAAAQRALSDEEKVEFANRANAVASGLRAGLRADYREYRSDRSERVPLRVQRR